MQQVIAWVLITLTSVASATDYYAIAPGATTTINEFGACQQVTNNRAKNLMIPTKYTAEWLSFRTKTPSLIALNACASAASGYLVMTASSWNGNLGGPNGADAKCVTELTANNWLGKASAGTFSPRVKAWLCNSYDCTNLFPTSSYTFATAGNATSGGASFSTNIDGQGPGDSANWSGPTYFGATATYHTGRQAGTSMLAPVTSDPNACSYYNSTSGNGAFGDPNTTDSNRWRSGAATCTTTRRLLCLVQPYLTPKATNSSTTFISGVSGSVSAASGSTGDLSVAHVTGIGGFTASTPPSGWTLVLRAGPASNGLYAEVWTKYRTAGEPTSYTWTGNGSGITVTIMNVINANTTTAIESAQANVSASSTSYTLPATTSTNGYGLLLGFVATLGLNSGMAAGPGLSTTTTYTTSDNSIMVVYRQLGDGASYALSRSGPLSPSAPSIAVSVVVNRP